MVAIEIGLFACGIYLIIRSILMKKSGTIPNLIVNGKINLERARDKEGYINYMFIRTIVFGALISVSSAFLAISDSGLCAVNPILLLLVQIVYVAALIYFAVVSVKAQNRFLI